MDNVQDFTPVVKSIAEKGQMVLSGNKLKTASWFLITNGAIVVSLAVISGGTLLGVAPLLLLLGGVTPFFLLLFSKYLAKRAHGIVVINEHDFQNAGEESIYQVVAELAKRANLSKTPEVGIYESEEANAFATGRSREHALVAFSTALLENFDEESIAAIAAHEISHLANGDMITMSILQGAINTIVLMITLPLYAVKLLAFFSEDIGTWGYLIISFFKVIVTAILLFLANLIAKAFSRRREYAADLLAAQMYEKEAMIKALEKLSETTVAVEPKQQAYATFKINGLTGFLEIFSTHPSFAKRIARLKAL